MPAVLDAGGPIAHLKREERFKRLREAVSQSEERYLNRIGLVIAVLGAIGTLQAVLALYGIKANMHEDVPLRHAVLGYMVGSIAFLISLSLSKWIRHRIVASLRAARRWLTHRTDRHPLDSGRDQPGR